MSRYSVAIVKEYDDGPGAVVIVHECTFFVDSKAEAIATMEAQAQRLAGRHNGVITPAGKGLQVTVNNSDVNQKFILNIFSLKKKKDE